MRISYSGSHQRIAYGRLHMCNLNLHNSIGKFPYANFHMPPAICKIRGKIREKFRENRGENPSEKSRENPCEKPRENSRENPHERRW